jgi:protein TonB
MRTTIFSVAHVANAGADLTDLVFANKNREYGAFALRKSYSKFLTIASFFTGMLFILGMSSPLIISFIKGTVAKKNADYTVCPISPFTIQRPQDTKPVETVVKPEVPIRQQTIQFIVPVIAEDVAVKEQYVPPIEDIPIARTTERSPVTDDIEKLGLPPVAPRFDAGPKEGAPVEKPVPFYSLEETPHFPGGDDQLISYFASTVKYPQIALRANVEGKVFVEFVITKDGNITNARIVKGIGAGCDDEALRVVRAMPAWTPGKQNGRAVPVIMSIPIAFKIK